MDNITIEAKNLSIAYNLNTQNIDNMKEYFISKIRGRLTVQEFWALKDVSFTLEKGDSLGVVGLNGSGKSTLLKTIAGIIKPTKGTVRTVGRIAPLIELGAGFDPNLSARENIFLNGALLGYNRAFMRSKLDQIVEFAELEQFIDVPVKQFSSGMSARLGFAIATMDVPDILILDEVLSVGDYKFQEKSKKRTLEIVNSGATVLYVSHGADSVVDICNRAIWLEKGRLVMEGSAEEVALAYDPAIAEILQARKDTAAREETEAGQQPESAAPTP